MKLLKVRNPGRLINPRPLTSAFVVRLDWIPDREFREAVLAANINILRRHAPYAYLVACDHYLEEWLTDTNPYAATRLYFEDAYLQNMEARQLSRGLRLTESHSDFNTTTVVVSILQGDVLPAIQPLNDDEFCLLCLPQKISLDQIDHAVRTAKSVEACLAELLETGGFILSLVDHVVLQIKTMNSIYAQYFE